LQQLVAPIALYPDSHVARILSAATFPEQVVEADRWIQAHPNLKGNALVKAVDQQPWDPSVKALTAFPSVLGNMDKNLSWTSTLGDTYYNQPEDVMAAVQVMWQKAKEAGNLKTTQQQGVKTEGSTIIIESADPEVVYVPAYDPWAVYGVVIVAWPGWYHYSEVYYEGTYVYFGVAVYVGYYHYYYGWDWHHWGCDWYHHYAEHDHERYYSRSRTYYNRNHYYRSSSDRESSSRKENRSSNRSSSERGNANNQSGTSSKASEGDTRAARGYGDSRGQSNTRTGGFSNYNHGGEERSYSARGNSSLGAGGPHGGSGPFSGGGFPGGGGPHR
jgi:hypothetical protein